MGKSTAEKLWCIKVLCDAAFLFKVGRQIQNFKKIVEAEAVEKEPASNSTSALSPTASASKKVIKVNLNTFYQVLTEAKIRLLFLVAGY